MSSPGEAIKRMIELGATPEMVAAAVDAIVSATANAGPSGSARTARQERNARYYQHRKERLKASETSELRRFQTVSDGVSVPPPEEMSPTPPKTQPSTQDSSSPPPEAQAPSSARTSRGHRLPQDWQASEADRDFARQQGWTDTEIDQAEAEFRDYWHSVPGKQGTKLDWSATWRNRIRQMGPRRTRTNGRDPPRNPWIAEAEKHHRNLEAKRHERPH